MAAGCDHVNLRTRYCPHCGLSPGDPKGSLVKYLKSHIATASKRIEIAESNPPPWMNPEREIKLAHNQMCKWNSWLRVVTGGNDKENKSDR